jgi:hypothetical protein
MSDAGRKAGVTRSRTLVGEPGVLAEGGARPPYCYVRDCERVLGRRWSLRHDLLAAEQLLERAGAVRRVRQRVSEVVCTLELRRAA